MPFSMKKVNIPINVVLCRTVGMYCLILILVFGGLSGCGSVGADELYFQEDALENDGEDQLLLEADLVNPADAAYVTEDSAKEAADAVNAAADRTADREQDMTDGPKQEALFVVHICGAVQEPGVYELPQDCRVMDAVEAAGGFTQDAARDARNLAEPVTDGSMIRIPTGKEAEAEQAAAQSGVLGSTLQNSAVVGTAAVQEDGAALQNSTSSKTQEGLVNINTADAAMLQTLPGIGKSRAAAIIDYRENHGAFSCIEDIMKVAGIKQASFEKLKGQITV